MHAIAWAMLRAAPGRGWRRVAIATVAAYALALQTLLAGLGGGLHAPQAGTDALCSPAADGASAPNHGTPAAHPDLCCLFACHAPALGGSSLSQRSEAPLLASPAHASLGKAVPEVASRKLRPLGSRAPPVAA